MIISNEKFKVTSRRRRRRRRHTYSSSMCTIGNAADRHCYHLPTIAYIPSPGRTQTRRELIRGRQADSKQQACRKI